MTIREAAVEDAATMRALLNCAAAFHQHEDLFVATVERLTTTMFGPNPFARALLAVGGEPCGVETATGIATYYFTYSTFRARPRLYLEDLFVVEDQRGHGIGTALMRRLATIATTSGCFCMEWQTPSADDNRALPFYRRLGATAADLIDEGTHFLMRLDEEGIRRLASQATLTAA